VLTRTLKLTLVFIFLSLLVPPNAYAYLDPGSGSYLIQIIVASSAGLGYLIKINWKKIRGFFSGRNKQFTENENEKKPS